MLPSPRLWFGRRSSSDSPACAGSGVCPGRNPKGPYRVVADSTHLAQTFREGGGALIGWAATGR